MATLDWNKDFEIMCDASDYAMGEVLGQRIDKTFRPYTMPEKLLMRHKRTTQLQKMRCWQWYLLVKSLGYTYWGPMSSYTLIMQ